LATTTDKLIAEQPVPRKTLEDFAKLASAQYLINGQIRGLVRWQRKLWAVTSVGYCGGICNILLCCVVPAAKWKEKTLSYDDSGDNFRGLLANCRKAPHRGRWVLTGNVIELVPESKR
jgi:hypothetical protein